MILLKEGMNCRIPVWVILLLCGIFLMNKTCESSDRNRHCQLKNSTLFVNITKVSHLSYYPKDVVEADGRKLCFSIHDNKTQGGCCNDTGFNCSFDTQHRQNSFSLIVSKEILSMQDIVLMTSPNHNFSCISSPSINETGSLLNIHKCLGAYRVKNFRVHPSLCGEKISHYQDANKDSAEINYIFTVQGDGLYCGQAPCPDLTLRNDYDTGLEASQNIIKNISTQLKQMTNCSTLTFKTDNIRGIVARLPSRNDSDITFGFTTTKISILEDNKDYPAEMSHWVKISREASEMALQQNSSFVGLLLIPGVYLGVPGLSFLNNEVVEIEMGADIFNLSETVDIHFRNVDKRGNVASCRSWDGKGEEPVWIKDGCHTTETNDSITCHCSHLTFFGILLSPPPGNISSADLTALTHITRIGCGLSMFFLAAAIFMHCLLRQRRSSQATEILMNLFVAMFTLNLSFLVNDKIAETGNRGACLAIAAFLHYTMLATLNFFFMEALHIYFTMWKLPSQMKHYMAKICITAWVTPAAVVIPLLAVGEYDYLVISVDDGTSARMCWIPDTAVHQGINIGYYTIVFIFTTTIFIIAVRQICLLQPEQDKTQTSRSSLFSIVGLLLLLGITWAFAFFSHGPLRIPSFYIFTILNSFQGFFLFIYYYYSSKAVGESSSTASNTTVTSLNQ